MPSSKKATNFSFMKQKLGAPSDHDVEQLKSENQNLQQSIELMEKKIEDIQAEIAQARGS